jgi:signal peptidase I
MDPQNQPPTSQPQQHPLDRPAPQAPAPGTPPPTNPLDINAIAGPTPGEPTPEPQSDSALGSIARGFTGILGGIFSWIIFPVAVVLILHNFVFQAYHVLGTSMVNTLHDTDYLIISKLGYTSALIGRTFGKNDPYLPARGQIIVFHYPKDPTKIFVKRVIGEPGDHVVIKNGTVTIYNQQHPNGFNPDTAYEPSGTQTLIDTDETVPADNLFVMGDNRTPGGSYDSREWGYLPSSYIIGNAVLRLLPLDQVKIL